MGNSVEDIRHDHLFLGADHARNERRVWLVIALTTVMMVAEISAGIALGSMALTADGWHMATHAGAMLIAALAYLYARREASNPRFTFGTGKLGDLAGFASAVILALIALLIAWESLMRLTRPVAIDFEFAIPVAVLGLVVNLACAWLLRDDHGHHHHAGHHRHDHDHGHHHHEAHATDHNLRAAYLHVLADALTSILAILALVLGSVFGWNWPDPVMGIVGGLVIARWSWGLIRETAATLLDARQEDLELAKTVRARLETGADRLADLHVWQLGPGHSAVIASLVTPSPQAPAFYKRKLDNIPQLAHVTIEVTPAS